MTFLKVSGNMGATRFSKGKIAGAVLMLIGAYTTLVPFLNGLVGWNLPTPTPESGQNFANTLDSLFYFLSGLGIFGIRSAQN